MRLLRRLVACKLGLEGIVSRRRDSPYSSGRSRHWIKSKNPNAPAVKREAEFAGLLWCNQLQLRRLAAFAQLKEFPLPHSERLLPHVGDHQAFQPERGLGPRASHTEEMFSLSFVFSFVGPL
jgi:hypothetical protein